jgi:topoisomerase-4 subunit B
MRKDGSIEIEDNGRGIPFGINSTTKISTIDTVFTVLHAGGKFNEGAYKTAGGLHGVGASVVNALSS